MSDLRDLWPRLSDRQRDELVGKALGWTVVQAGLPWWWRTPDGATLDAGACVGLASSWPGFGLIWEECERRGWHPEVARATKEECAATLWNIGMGEAWLSRTSMASASGRSPVQALALAFCVAAGVEVPAEWLAA